MAIHAARCARHTGLHRRNDVRDHVAQYAHVEGVAATVEQNRPMDEAGARPVHRADIYLIDQQAKEMWLDVRIATAAPDVLVALGGPRPESARSTGSQGRIPAYYTKVLFPSS